METNEDLVREAIEQQRDSATITAHARAFPTTTTQRNAEEQAWLARDAYAATALDYLQKKGST